VGFIDVPGHRRFINTMIAGISGIDLGLLVVAADDGLMPQTLEHLDVLAILGIERLLIAVTKIDRADNARVDAVADAASAAATTRGMSVSGTFQVDNLSGAGIETLTQALQDCAGNYARTTPQGCFRLPIDRAFNVRGTGLVVTGTAQSGAVAIGDTLQLLPGNRAVRVRGIRVHDEEAPQAMAATRCALNLAGIDLDDVQRGDWLLAQDCAAPGAFIDVDVALLEASALPLKHLAPVKLYLGASRVAARLALPDSTAGQRALLPGQRALAQLRLDTPLPVYRGQRFLLRDHAETYVLGGGTVLQLADRATRRFTPSQVAVLETLRFGSADDCLTGLLTQEGLIDIDRFAATWNLTHSETDTLYTSLKKSPGRICFEQAGTRYLASDSQFEDTAQHLHATLSDWHRSQPQERGLKAGRLRDGWLPASEMPLVAAVLGREIKAGAIHLADGYLSLSGFQPRRPAALDRAWSAYEPLLRQRDTRIPLLSEIHAQTDIAIEQLRQAAEAKVREGAAFRVSERRYALPHTLRTLCEGVLELVARNEAVTVIALKNQWGLGRNLVVEIIEFLDSVRFTVRRGEARVIIDPALPDSLFGDGAE
jgi:selenocysteine-specific elongation factor